MQSNMNLRPETVIRPSAHFVYLERTGPFAEIAPPAWEELFRLLAGELSHEQFTELLGLSRIDGSKQGKDSMIYQAGVCLASQPAQAPKDLQYRKLEGGKYAQFLLTGPYAQIGVAFEQIFRALSESNTPLREEYCIENYLNDPKVTPEDRLQTQILIPVA